MQREFADLAESPAHLASLCYHDELVGLYVHAVLGRIRILSMQVLTKYFATFIRVWHTSYPGQTWARIAQTCAQLTPGRNQETERRARER